MILFSSNGSTTPSYSQPDAPFFVDVPFKLSSPMNSSFIPSNIQCVGLVIL